LNYETPLTPPLLNQGGVGGGNFKFRNYPAPASSAGQAFLLPLFKGRRNASGVIQGKYAARLEKIKSSAPIRKKLAPK